MPNDLDPDHRLTLRQADQAREDFAQILDELDFVKMQIVRLPTGSEVRWIALRLTLGALAAVWSQCRRYIEPRRPAFIQIASYRSCTDQS